ncbi:helix-turn-helix domain-containing protein [Streptococcus sp. zg-JUN1979]|uniref:helix-turn-helix domain-containing protein n=1 Tax=Streptococcus sp. zg-JUN1979 TaxID=3391450 RepID=UPI0039A62872
MFAERLKELRLEARLTQKEIANQIKVGQNSYSNWENGKRIPIFPTVEKLASLFNVSPDYLLGKTDIKENLSEELSEKQVDKVKDNILQTLSKHSHYLYQTYGFSKDLESHLSDLENHISNQLSNLY